ncbi:YidH family protein [Citricoccus sp. GCM10030269]|uniref:YidH family protein n=1 Tax=Citricoccus sp. GCM10030269 TaxID=3273388 RepID=UPI0036234A67
MTTSEPNEPVARGRVAGRVLDGGREPDPRFTLANERTFLAWIRTSLALIAGGIAVEAFTSSVFDALTRTVLGALLLFMAALLAITAGFRWVRVERAMRHGRPLPLPVLVPVLATAGAASAVVLLVFLLLRPA